MLLHAHTHKVGQARPSCRHNSLGQPKAMTEACTLLQTQKCVSLPLPSYHGCISTCSYLLPTSCPYMLHLIQHSATPATCTWTKFKCAAVGTERGRHNTADENNMQVHASQRNLQQPQLTLMQTAASHHKQPPAKRVSRTCTSLHSRKARAQLPSRPSQHASLSLAHRHLCSANSTADNQPLQQSNGHTLLLRSGAPCHWVHRGA